MNSRIKQAFEFIADSSSLAVAQKTVAGAGVTGLVSAAAGWNWTGLIATVVAVLGFFVSLYYKRKEDARRTLREKRESELHKARMARLERHVGLCGQQGQRGKDENDLYID